MPTLKSELERMVQVVGSRAGMPSGATVKISPSVTSYIAPDDGWVALSTEMNNSNLQTVKLSVLPTGVSATHWLPMAASIALFVPIAKGQTALLTVPNGNAWVQFGKTLGSLAGGGLKRLISNVFFGGRYGFA